MQKSDNNHHHHHHSDTEIVGGNDRTSYSGPLSGPLSKRPTGKRSARFYIPGEASTSSAPANSNNDYVEITLDVRDDSVAVHSVKAADGGEVEDPELAALARGLKKKSSVGSSVRNASSRIRQVSEELKRLASITRRPRPVRGRFDRTTSATAHALKGLKFISKKDGSDDWNTVEEKFKKLTKDTKGLLPPEKFGECLGMNAEFAGKLFDALNRRSYITNDVESINKEQLKRYWEQISDQSFDTRLQIFFDMADKDDDGRIAEEEVTEIIALSASTNKLKIIQDKAGEYARMIMEALDPDGIGYIMIEDLEMLLLQGPSQSVRGERESRNLSMMLSESLKPTRDNVVKRWYRDFNYFVIDNWQRIWVMALWIGVMAALFTYKYIQYKNREVFEVMGHCVCFAKGAGETLKLNMALVLLPVCRNTITWLRNKTRLGVAVPFDDNLNFHKVIAVAIGMGVGIHGITHLACDFPRLLSATPDEYEPMEDFFGDQPTSYWWFIKGWEGVTGIVMVVLMAIAFTLATPLLRRGNIKLPKRLEPLNNLIKLAGFNAFWYSHHLFVIVYACLIIHGIKLYLTKEWYKKTTWMYLAIPLTLYASERMIRVFRSSIKPVQLLKVAKYPANVLTLHMSKPDGFKYKSGQYIFVNCAKVSPFQWHPFSITSAPKDDYVSVHIRQFGDWTTDLHDVFEKFCSEQDQDTGKSGPFRAGYLRGENNPDLPKVKIDGPYGAPTQDYKSYDVVLLVGLGIGATPMISVVKDIINNIKAKEEEEEHALEEGQGPSPLTKPKRSTGLINVVKDIINNMMKAKEEEEEEEDEHMLEEGQGPSPLTKPKQSKGSASGSHNFKTRKAYFYWMTREQGSFDWFKGVMNDVAEMDNKKVIEIHNYCTSVYEEGDARSALITMLQSINHAKNGVDIVSGTRVMSHFGKPDWRSVYKRVALNHPHKTVGVFYCGAPPPVKELRHLASNFSHKTNTKFEFHKENF